MPASEIPDWVASWQPDPSWSTQTRVGPEDLPLIYASVDHRSWIRRIETYIEGDPAYLPEMDSHHCRFGVWLDGDGKSRYGALPRYPSIEQLHLQVHVVAEEVLKLHHNGHHGHALSKFGELSILRDDLLGQLAALHIEHRSLKPVGFG